MDLNPISSIVNGVFTGLKSIITSDKDRIALENARIELEQKLPLAQIEVNKAEAQNPSLFVAGWRPFIGWLCGCVLAFVYVISPLLISLGLNIPHIDSGELITLLLGMLGMGGLRSFDKQKGTDTKAILPRPPRGLPDIPPPSETK